VGEVTLDQAYDGEPDLQRDAEARDADRKQHEHVTPSEANFSACRRITAMPSGTPIAAPALDDITNTKNARAILGKIRKQASGEPVRS
jgi:hypothetical protein